MIKFQEYKKVKNNKNILVKRNKKIQIHLKKEFIKFTYQ